MKRYLLAAMFSLVAVGFVIAEEFTLQISAVNNDGTVTGKKIAIAKGKGAFGKADEVTVKLAKDVKIPKGKYDTEAKAFAADGDDLKLAGLQADFQQAQNGSVLVAGKSISDKDTLELSMHDGKPSAKLNGKDVPFADVTVKGKAALTTRVTTGDDGVATSILITGGGGGGFGKGKGKAD
jgi:hypothetical protein